MRVIRDIVRRKIAVIASVVIAVAVISAALAITYFVGSTTVQGPPIDRDYDDVAITLAIAGQPPNASNPIVIDRGPVNITYTVTNNRDSVFQYISFSRELRVYDLFGRLVWNEEVNPYVATSASIAPRSQEEFSTSWSMKIRPGGDFNMASIEAPAGLYTVRLGFSADGVTLSDAKIIMIKW